MNPGPRSFSHSVRRFTWDGGADKPKTSLEGKDPHATQHGSGQWWVGLVSEC